MFRFVLVVMLSLSTAAMASNLEVSLLGWTQSYGFKTPTHQKRAIIKAAIKHSAAYGVNPVLTLAILNVESSFNVSAQSPTGPKCLMQVATTWHQDKIQGRDIYDVNTCLDVGVAIIKECARNGRGIDKVLACYSGYHGNDLLHYIGTVKSRYRDFVMLYERGNRRT